MKTLKQEITHKKPVFRSVAYPAFNIEYSIDLTKLIYSNFGKSNYNTREEIAKVLKKSADYLKSPLSSASQYGLLDMKQKAGYRPTDLFMQLYKQDDEDIKRQALLQCLRNPKLYSLLINAYENDILPSKSALANILFKKYYIAENTSEKATEVFIENLNLLNLLNAENKLSLTATGETQDEYYQSDEEIQEEFKPSLPITQNTNSKRSVHTYNMDAIVEAVDELPMYIKLHNGRKAKLIYPQDVTNDDWEKIVRVIEAMKE